MNYSQRGRMEEQRCALSPVITRQTIMMPNGMRHAELQTGGKGFSSWHLDLWSFFRANKQFSITVANRQDMDDMQMTVPSFNSQVMEVLWQRGICCAESVSKICPEL